MRALAGLLFPLVTGCAVVPKKNLEETRGANRELRTELAETKDSLAKLRSQNRDLAARSIEESRRNIALEEANARFEHDITVYQEEREQYAAALDQIKSQVLASSGRSKPTTALDPIGPFLASYPGSHFDPATRCLSLPAENFFADGTARLLPKPTADLDRLARNLASSDPGDWSIRVVGGEAATGRVEAVRDVLARAGLPLQAAARAGADPSLVRVVARNPPGDRLP